MEEKIESLLATIVEVIRDELVGLTASDIREVLALGEIEPTLEDLIISNNTVLRD